MADNIKLVGVVIILFGFLLGILAVTLEYTAEVFNWKSIRKVESVSKKLLAVMLWIVSFAMVFLYCFAAYGAAVIVKANWGHP